MRIIVPSIILITSLISCKEITKQATQSADYDSLKIILENMVDKDQNIRRILVDSIGINSTNAAPFIKQMMDIDADNQRKIKLILTKYGLIEQSKIGKKAAEAFFYIIQHSDTSLMARWFPEFKRLAEIDEADKEKCAMMEDRLLMWRGEMQLYGTQATVFREDKKLAVWPIKDSRNVNERREKKGFELTVQENAARLGAIYNENEQLPTRSKQ